MSLDANLLLFEFILNENLKEAFLLLDLRHTPVNGRNLSGFTPVHFAVANKKECMVQMLMGFAPDLNLPSYFECGQVTPLMTAVKIGSLNLVDVLLKKGAGVNVVDNQGMSALHYAARTGRIDIIQSLVDYGADPNLRDNFGFNPAYYASEFGHIRATPELSKLLGKPMKITSKDIRVYREDYLSVHTIEDMRKKPRNGVKKGKR